MMTRHERLEAALARDNRADAGHDELQSPEHARLNAWIAQRFAAQGGDPRARLEEAYHAVFGMGRPVSAIPRILSPSQSDRILRGVRQRARLFRAIHEDLTSPDGWILRKYPEIETMLRTYHRYAPPAGVRWTSGKAPMSTLVGVDLILGAGDAVSSNEVNVGSDVMGPADMFHLRRASSLIMPEALGMFGVQADLGYPRKLEEIALREMELLGARGVICWVRSNLSFDEIRANNDAFFHKEVTGFSQFVEGTRMRHVWTRDMEVIDGVPRIKSTGEPIGFLWFNGHPAWIEAVNGLNEAIATGRVGYNAYSNSDYLGDQTLQCFLPELAERFLPGEELLVEVLPTFSVSPRFDGQLDEKVLDAWARHPERLVLKERSSQGGKSVYVGRFISAEEHAQTLEKIRANPSEFLVQAYTPISRMGEGRRVDLRMICHMGLTDETTYVVPAGVSRSSVSAAGKTNLTLGGAEHDTWFRSG